MNDNQKQGIKKEIDFSYPIKVDGKTMVIPRDQDEEGKPIYPTIHIGREKSVTFSPDPRFL